MPLFNPLVAVVVIATIPVDTVFAVVVIVTILVNTVFTVVVIVITPVNITVVAVVPALITPVTVVVIAIIPVNTVFVVVVIVTITVNVTAVARGTHDPVIIRVFIAIAWLNTITYVDHTVLTWLAHQCMQYSSLITCCCSHEVVRIIVIFTFVQEKPKAQHTSYVVKVK